MNPAYSSQTCSVCGVLDGPKPLKVRTWTCQGCGSVVDRDYNAATNIMVTAGAWRHPGAATRAADQGVPAMACIARPDTPPSMSSFNESSVVREQAGQPTGGRFAEKVKAGSGLALREESPAEPVH